MKKTGLNGYVYEYNVHYNNLNITDFGEAIPFIHKYLMLKYDIE